MTRGIFQPPIRNVLRYVRQRTERARCEAENVLMANLPPALNIASLYEDFLFAGIWYEHGGMRLSVLSALARMDFDPWEEAARLATLPTPEAERTLVSTLNLLPGHPQRSAETETLAARLVALLPRPVAATTAKVAPITGAHEQQVSHWLVWLCIALAISFISSHRHATTTSVEASASTSNTAPPAASRGAGPAPSGVNSRADRAPTIPSTGLTAR